MCSLSQFPNKFFYFFIGNHFFVLNPEKEYTKVSKFGFLIIVSVTWLTLALALDLNHKRNRARSPNDPSFFSFLKASSNSRIIVFPMTAKFSWHKYCLD